MPSAKDPRVTSTRGHAPDDDGAAPGPIDPATGQHTSYWILTEEERSKGFVRPVRLTYKHVGESPTYPTRELTAEEHERYDRFGYVLYEEFPEEVRKERGVTGTYWTKGRLKPGCGTVTRMPQSIAETYARQPDFYGSTFCSGCGKHLAVSQFVWDGTDERVGS